MTKLFFDLSYDYDSLDILRKSFEVNKVPEFMMIHYRTRG